MGQVEEGDTSAKVQECRKALRECAEAAEAASRNPQQSSGAGGDSGAAWCQALWLLGEINASTRCPDSVSHSAAISACAAGGRWAEVLQLLADLGGSGGSTSSANVLGSSALSTILSTGALPPGPADAADTSLVQSEDEQDEEDNVDAMLGGVEASLAGCTLVWRQTLELLAGARLPVAALQPPASPQPATPDAAEGTPIDVLGLSGTIQDTAREGQWRQALTLLDDLRQMVSSQACRTEDAASTAAAVGEDNLFASLDLNRDGVIDRQEMRRAIHAGLITSGDGLLPQERVTQVRRLSP